MTANFNGAFIKGAFKGNKPLLKVNFGLNKIKFATKIYARSLKMARKCAISGKGPMSGNNVSHAKNRTKRRFLPNLRTVRVTLEDGTTKKLKIAASELRTLKKDS